jgi:phage baseplate assembly protein V
MTTAYAAPAHFNYAHHSLVPATVTRSYHKLGRVKVRFPWMDSKQESNWIAVVAPAAGDKCGVFFMPEENDQVLVAFSYGHVERSYIIGVLWSDARKPPDEDREKRQLRSRSGHTITLDDTKDAELISIVDKSGKNKLVLDAKHNTITIDSGGDLTITAKGKLALNSTDGDVSINGKNVTIETAGNLAAKGKAMTLTGDSVNVNNGALEVK